VSTNILYFAYDASLDPDRLSAASPGARFLFTAHYPETRLAFVESASGGRPVPTLIKDPSHTVWGGVFEVPGEEASALVAAFSDGRSDRFDERAVDREGNKHECLTFIADGNGASETLPDPDYVSAMIRGAKHWSLPAGWVLGLDDLDGDLS
jgi:hypothetical protein